MFGRWVRPGRLMTTCLTPAEVDLPPVPPASTCRCRMPSALRPWSNNYRARWCSAAVVGACLSIFVSNLSAAEVESLAKRIDRQIEAKYSGPRAPQADDAELVRRTYLDLIGRVPTVEEARAYLSDKSADKRVKLVDRLLTAPEHSRRMTEAFHATLMERRGEHEEWTAFLREAFAKNMAWDELVRHVIDPRDDDPALRGAAFFAVNRLSKVGQQETDYPGLTRDVGRLFLGKDLACAQCHNHLFIDDYKQVDFQGLYTVFLNTAIRTDVKYPALGENLMTKPIEFMSVFDKKPLATGPRVPGLREIAIPTFAKGEEYVSPPDRKTKAMGVPKFSPLEKLAEEITSPKNRAFRENIANRLWWLVMGRGLVDPLDQTHVANPPSHPELLKLLADEMLARKYDLRAVLRELVLTEVYARGSAWNATRGGRPEPATYGTAVAKPLSAEQMYHSYLAASGPHGPKAHNAGALRERFTKAFANPPKEPEIEFAPSVKAALFLSNDDEVLRLTVRDSGNLVDRLVKLAEAKDGGADAAAEELYLAVLSRKPTADERREVGELVTKYANERAKLFGQLTWALLSSTEFCLNH
ncbi:MAG: hypothetical protein C0483_12035 [Pirellula sp.]|nr:hypothetical protein [Pirellula sp.]